MENSFTVRLAKNHDAKKIFDFICKLEEQLFDIEEFLLNYQACISAPNNIYLVAASENNEALGFIGCQGQLSLHNGDMIYEIHELFVDTGFRNKGIGKSLLKELCDILVSKQCDLLQVSTRRWRMEARKFFSDNGFASTHMKSTKKLKLSILKS